MSHKIFLYDDPEEIKTHPRREDPERRRYYRLEVWTGNSCKKCRATKALARAAAQWQEPRIGTPGLSEDMSQAMMYLMTDAKERKHIYGQYADIFHFSEDGMHDHHHLWLAPSIRQWFDECIKETYAEDHNEQGKA